MNRTRELLAEHERGASIVASLFDGIPVSYEPRQKYDPKPWTDGVIRFSSRMCEARKSDEVTA
jgi:hypothetical protein